MKNVLNNVKFYDKYQKFWKNKHFKFSFFETFFCYMFVFNLV